MITMGKNMKKMISIRLDVELFNRLKNVVWYKPGATQSNVFEKALEDYIDNLEKINGSPYKERPWG